MSNILPEFSCSTEGSTVRFIVKKIVSLEEDEDRSSSSVFVSDEDDSFMDEDDPSFEKEKDENDSSFGEDDPSFEEEKDEDDSFCSEDDPSFEEEKDEDMHEESSESVMNKKDETLNGEKRNLPCILKKHIYLPAFRSWPILNLLQPEFIMQIRKVMVYDNGNRALITTKDKNVYTFEYNKDNQMKTRDTYIGLYLKKIEKLCGMIIKTFTCSSYFVFALTAEGKVYFWRFKKNINDNSRFFEITPTQMIFGSTDKYIMKVACGSDHCLALTDRGDVYAWVLDNDKYNFTLPCKVKCELLRKKISSICCGSMFNLVMTNQGKLYSWGKNFNWFDKAISRPTVDSSLDDCYPVPFLIDIKGAIVQLACGSEHTLALTKEGKVYAWGNNSKGQLGNNKSVISAPIMVNLPTSIVDIAAYADLSVAVDSRKNIYVWGDCFGQNITTPFLTGFTTIYDAFAYTTSRVMHNTLVVTDEGNSFNIMEFQGLDDLEMTFNDPMTSDFIVKIEEKCFYVHKRILSIRSQHFNKMFRDVTKNNKRGIQNAPIKIYEVPILLKFSYIVYETFLKYLYTGKVDSSSKIALDLLRLAHIYNETELQKECSRIIEKVITEWNVAFFYEKAIFYYAKELEVFCFKFALRHMKGVVLSDSYRNLDLTIKNTFIKRAAQSNAFHT